MSHTAPATHQPDPVQVHGSLLASQPAAAYRVLTVSAPGIPERFRPGQFLAIAVGGQHSAMLGRRAFSVHEAIHAREARPGAPEVGHDAVRIVVAVHGDGTAWLAGLRPDEPLDVVGPLGQPFTTPEPGVPCVLVGGGYGSAPLFSLADLLLERGHEVHFVLGAATADRVFGVERARRTATSTTVTTVDGSIGRGGVVTDALPELFGERPRAAVYACGPMPMLRAVTAVATDHGAATQVAVEESMACGIGVCMTCVLPVVGGDGVTRMTRSCIEGPVFAGDAVRWQDIGTVPADVWGGAGA